MAKVMLGRNVLQAVHLQGIVRNSGRIMRKLNVSLPTNWSGPQESGMVLAIFWWPLDWTFFEVVAEVDSNQFNASVGEKASSPGTQKPVNPLDALDGLAQNENHGAAVEGFFSAPDKLKHSLVDILGLDNNQAGDYASNFAQRHAFVAAKLRVPSCVLLEITIDTDHTKFAGWTKDASGSGENALEMASNENGNFILQLGLRVLGSRGQPLKWLGENNSLAGTVDVNLGRVRDLGDIQGVLGFDIGNNNSTIAYLANDAAGDHTKITLLVADPAAALSQEKPEHQSTSEKEDSILSAVRITKYQSQGATDNFPVVERTVGKQAVEISSLGRGQLFPGAKRILADLSKKDPLDLMLGQLHKIDRALPAELLITTLIQRVHQTLQMKSFPVVATYPSTYTKAEIDRVRFSISKAIHRGMNQSKVTDEKVANRGKVTVPRLYDEASSAAFFYLYRDFIRGPGRLTGLHFLYPRGVNLLLFDCGGGTTDIALLHAHTLQDSKLGDNALWGVNLTNLGRTGNRYFGGDDITAAFYRVIKWYFANAIEPLNPAPPSEASAVSAETVDHLKSLDDQINRIIPTKFEDGGNRTIGNTQTPMEKQRTQASRVLWDFSEQVKVWVSSETPELRQKSLEQLEKFMAIVNNKQLTAVRKSLSDLVKTLKKNVLRAMVDLMIKPEVDATIDAANSLIGELDTRLQSMVPGYTEAPSFVHHVYIVGRAAHYPYIRERLECDLRIPYLSKLPIAPNLDLKNLEGRAQRVSELGLFHPRMIFDTKNLKGSVVRGAVLMRMAENLVQKIKVVYDEQLSERLPFSIGIDANDLAPETLFKEHCRYSELPPKSIPAPDVPPQNPRQSIVLQRKWPGTEKWEPFLEFVFDPPVKGNIIVSYDDSPENQLTLGFKVDHQDEENGLRTAVGRIISSHPVLSPLERGDL